MLGYYAGAALDEGSGYTPGDVVAGRRCRKRKSQHAFSSRCHSCSPIPDPAIPDAMFDGISPLLREFGLEQKVLAGASPARGASPRHFTSLMQ